MIGNRRLKMIDGKVCIVMFSNLGVEVKSGKFTPLKFSDHKSGYRYGGFRIDGRPTLLYEHRLVWKLANPEWDIFDSSLDNLIDHYNRDKKDNRLENLHLVNNQQNTWNTDAKGYTLTPQGKYKAQLRIDYDLKYLGTFDTAEEARASYLEAKKKYHLIV